MYNQNGVLLFLGSIFLSEGREKMQGIIYTIESIPWTYITLSLYAINIIIALTIIFLERKNPAATLAWIMILFLLPGIGILFYFFLSQNIARKKIFRLTKDEERLLTSSLEKQTRAIETGTYEFTTYEADLWKDLIRLNQIYGRAYYTQDNNVEVITDGKEKMNQLLWDIENAKETINIMYFILKRDKVGREFVDTLTRKAAEGVKVRLLLDAMGSRNISFIFLHEFINSGGEYALFFPPKLKFINMKLNYRNHRKLAVIDDTIGYIGGFNIAKEYLGLKKKFGYWRDTHLRITGGSVQDINARFLMDWRLASKEKKVDVSKVFFEPPMIAGETGMQIVSGGPDTEHDEIKRAFMKMITSASRTINIQTPYFVPDAPVLESIKMAALSGVDVKIMIPCKPDHVFVYWATYSYVGELLRDGARVFIYENGFLHAKTMTVDGEVATVGSTNFDSRSFKLNFESNAFIYDAETTRKLEKIFQDDLANCRELTYEDYLKRSPWIKFKESISRLPSDLL